MGLARKIIFRVVGLKWTWDQCPKFTNWVVQLFLVLYFRSFWVYLGSWTESLLLGSVRVCYAIPNVFSHKWNLGNDPGGFQVPTCMLNHKYMIWKRWDCISKYFLGRMDLHSRSEFVIRFYCFWFVSTCDFYIWSLDYSFNVNPTLKLVYWCLVSLWFLVWTMLTHKLGRIGQHYWLSPNWTALRCLFVKIIVNSSFGVRGSSIRFWKGKSI